MKTAGMIGGIGPESTAIYYRLIVDEYRKAKADGSYPSIFINSIDMRKLLDLVIAGDLGKIANHLLNEVEKLAAAGATFGFLTANAPHMAFELLRKSSPIPLISIVETACAAAKEAQFRRLGLIGARFTMQAKFYPQVFSQAGIELVMPDSDEQNYIHEKYMGELVSGMIVPETREKLVSIMERMQRQDGIEGMILGGTELSLLFHENAARGIPLLDTTKIHVRAVAARLLE